MNLNEMTIGEAMEIAAMFNGIAGNKLEIIKNPAIGKYCIVRCRNAGVHAGIVEDSNAEFAVLKNSRRMWQWKSEFTLSEASKTGIIEDGSKIAAEIDMLIIPACDIAEFMPCTDEAEKSIRGAKKYHAYHA